MKDLQSPRYVRLRELLAECRKRAGLTQAALGERLGMCQTGVSGIESGRLGIDAIGLFDIAGAIGISPQWLCEQIANVQPESCVRP